MQYRQTPPIQWLPVFEAAASQLSFKKAAETLHVTPPAVSQQIKAFEAWLGVQLFERRARQLALTEEGQFYLDIAQEVLHAHTQGYVRFSRRFDHRLLRISTSIFVAQELLLPNYLSFPDFCADTELRIEAGTSLVDLETESIHATIRFGTGTWPNVSSKKLCDVDIAPVCSPEYLARNPIGRITDLKSHRIIVTSSMLEDWKQWGLVEDLSSQDKMVCDSYMSAIKAASAGLGVAMGIFPITNDWVNRGLLALPLAQSLRVPYAYWVCAPHHHPHPATDAFYRWSKSLFEQIPNLENSG